MSIANFNIARLISQVPGYDPYKTAGDCWFDEDSACDAIDFIEQCCTHVKGDLAKSPLILENWQKAIIGNLFGWKRPDGSRRYREAFIFIPRKNGKTLLAASIVNLVLYTDAEPGGELYSAASESDQSKLCFDVVEKMIRNEPEMDRRAKIFKYSISVGSNVYKWLSSTVGSKHGYNAHLIVNDELHAHKTPELTEVLMTSTGSRRQPMVVHITTSDYEREGSVCNDKHDYACKVRDGVIEDPSFLPVIYEASKDDDWTDPAVWKKANPNLGVSVFEDYLARECRRAQDDPSYENTFKRLHLNIRTEAASRWITTEAWDRCKQGIRIEDFTGQKCWCGLDLASTSDFTAFDIEFRTDGGVAGFTYFWVPEETARKREQERRIPYGLWARNGLLTLTPGNTTDYDVVRDDINAIVEKHSLNVQEIAVDRLFQGLDICRRLAEADGYEVIEHGQGMLGMAVPTKETKRLILSGELQHDGNAVMRWMIANTAVQTDAAGNEKPTRDKSSDKIDGVVAKIMATGRALADEGGSAYDEHDVRFI